MNKRNYALIENFLVDFLRRSIAKTGLQNAILGISGGIDSAVVAALAKKALGDNFLGAMIPTNSSSQSSLKDAKKLCETFEISYELINIGDLIDKYFEKDTQNKLRIGNFAARLRMAVLYDYSAKHNALVLGTSNKSELMLGYGTIYGDLAYAINPLSELYKTEIFEFATYLKIPISIIQKPPSADLWEGQSDEEELGFSYAQIDPLLHDISENSLNETSLKKKYDHNLVDMVLNRTKKNAFKHKPPIYAKFDDSLSEFDFLFPRNLTKKENI